MTQYNLLFWVFKVRQVPSEICKSLFDDVGAPDWVWPAFEEAYKQFKELENA